MRGFASGEQPKLEIEIIKHIRACSRCRGPLSSQVVNVPGKSTSRADHSWIDQHWSNTEPRDRLGTEGMVGTEREARWSVPVPRLGASTELCAEARCCGLPRLTTAHKL